MLECLCIIKTNDIYFTDTGEVSSDDDNTGAIVGVVVGGIVAAIIIIILIILNIIAWYCVKKREKHIRPSMH